MRKTSIGFMFMMAILVAAGGAYASTIIYYETPGAGGEQIIYANMMLNLMAHFDSEVTTADVAEYQSGDLGNYDYAVYIGYSYDFELPQDFLDDVATNQHRILWIGEGLHQLTDAFPGPGPFGFKSGEYNEGDGRDRIDYKGRFMERREELSFWDVEITGNPGIYSYLIPDGLPDQDHPHFLCGGNLCYLAEFPFWFDWIDDRMYVLADLLHEFYETDALENHKALFRFYELTPGMVDTANVRQVVDKLGEMDVPFAFAVVPIFKDVTGLIADPDTEWHFDDDPDLVILIDDMLDVGGVLIQLGVTHQHDDGTTGDAEFVQGESGDPLGYDAQAWVQDRIEAGLQEFAAEGWTPKIWETPWHLASHGDYLIFSEYFDYYLQNPQVFPVRHDADPIFATSFIGPTNQLMPFETTFSASNMGIAPANLGCVLPGTPGADFEDLRDMALRMSIVRDAVVSFCAYSGVDPDDMEDFVGELEDLGYLFTNPNGLFGITDDDDDSDDDWFPDDDADDDAADCHECDSTGDCVADLGEEHACVDNCCVSVPAWHEDEPDIVDDDPDDDAQIDGDDDDDSDNGACGC